MHHAYFPCLLSAEQRNKKEHSAKGILFFEIQPYLTSKCNIQRQDHKGYGRSNGGKAASNCCQALCCQILNSRSLSSTGQIQNRLATSCMQLLPAASSLKPENPGIIVSSPVFPG
jgi:hypothetical protein